MQCSLNSSWNIVSVEKNVSCYYYITVIIEHHYFLRRPWSHYPPPPNLSQATDQGNHFPSTPVLRKSYPELLQDPSTSGRPEIKNYCAAKLHYQDIPDLCYFSAREWISILSPASRRPILNGEWGALEKTVRCFVGDGLLPGQALMCQPPSQTKLWRSEMCVCVSPHKVLKEEVKCVCVCARARTSSSFLKLL